MNEEIKVLNTAGINTYLETLLRSTKIGVVNKLFIVLLI